MGTVLVSKCQQIMMLKIQRYSHKAAVGTIKSGTLMAEKISGGVSWIVSIRKGKWQALTSELLLVITAAHHKKENCTQKRFIKDRIKELERNIKEKMEPCPCSQESFEI